MITAIFLVLLLAGGSILFFNYLRWRRWAGVREIILPKIEQASVKEYSVFDLNALIINQNKVLSQLQGLDSQPLLKLTIAGGVMALLTLISLSGIAELSVISIMLSAFVTLLLFIFIPGFALRMMVMTKIKRMTDALPYCIDLMAVALQSGMTAESAIKFISTRIDKIDIHLCELFSYLSRRAEISGLEEALMQIYHAVNITEVRMFCSNLQQSVHYGTSIYENFIELAKDMRELTLLETEEKVGKLSAKISIPLIVFIMLPVTVLVAAPGILRVLKNGIF